MNIPQETLNSIKDEAKIKGNTHQYHPTDGDYTSYKFHGFIVEQSYISGATEWAEKASELVDLLEFIRNGLPENSNNFIRINLALAKYKEVTNKPDVTGKLNKLLDQANQACADFENTINKMKGRKICSQCGIDYDINQKHTCD